MRPGRELNLRIAKEVFGYDVRKHKGVLTENHLLGDRPMRNYSNDIEWAWEVAEKMKIMLIPTLDNQWFAFIGPAHQKGWESPVAALQFLEGGKFGDAGAAVGENPALAICLAAIKAVEKRQALQENTETLTAAQTEALDTDTSSHTEH